MLLLLKSIYEVLGIVLSTVLIIAALLLIANLVLDIKSKLRIKKSSKYSKNPELAEFMNQMHEVLKNHKQNI